MQTQKQRYYCYICEQHFQHPQSTDKCPRCQSQAIELAPETSDPSQFEVYKVQQGTNSSQQANNTTTNNSNNSQQGNFPNNLFAPLFGNGQMFHFQTRIISQQGNAPPSVFNMNVPMPMSMPINNTTNQLMQLNEILMMNGGLQQYLNNMMGEPHLTPATSQEINRLEKVNIVKECPICQQENLDDKKGYKLRCSHEFHVECLTPWMQRMNTCPACRQHI